MKQLELWPNGIPWIQRRIVNETLIEVINQRTLLKRLFDDWSMIRDFIHTALRVRNSMASGDPMAIKVINRELGEALEELRRL